MQKNLWFRSGVYMDWLMNLPGQIIGLYIAPVIYFVQENNVKNSSDHFFKLSCIGDFLVFTSFRDPIWCTHNMSVCLRICYIFYRPDGYIRNSNFPIIW